MNKIHESYNLSDCQKEMENLILMNKIESVIKNFPKQKIPGSEDCAAEFYQTFREINATFSF